MRLATALLCLLPFATLAGQHPRPAEDDALVFVTIRYANRAQLQAIASRFQHVLVDERNRTARAEASHDDIVALRRNGFRVEIDEPATVRMRRAEAAMSSVSTAESIPGYACYRTVEETYATMDQLAAARPGLARVIDIGPSWLASTGSDAGYRMKVLRLTNSATDTLIPDKPGMVVYASIHAREYTPAELLTRFGEWLVKQYGSDPQATWLLDNFRFHLVLQANPDGRKKAEAGLSWRKNVDNRNGVCSSTAYGIDLNRNFPFRWNSVSGGSSGDPCASTYRGPTRNSEPETQALLRYTAGSRGTDGVYRGGVLPDRRPDDAGTAAPSDYRGLFLDLHSYSRRVLWPWSTTGTLPPNAPALRTLGRRLAWFNGYTPQQWIGMYAADGTDTDTIYGVLGAPSYTIEMGISFFESCDTFESTTAPVNLAALRYAARALQAPYLYPSGPDTTRIGVSPTFVVPGNPVVVTATVNDATFNQSNGAEPVQRIASAAAFVDRAPWASGASPVGMVPADGSFDGSAEAVRVSIATGRLSPGRHMVFVRGVDASGRAGTPRAVFFTVANVQAFAARTTTAPLQAAAAIGAGVGRP